jgi:sugar (pentulose or hexulose) kinase
MAPATGHAVPADIIGAPVDRPQVLETTALGAAWLAGMRAPAGSARSRRCSPPDPRKDAPFSRSDRAQPDGQKFRCG